MSSPTARRSGPDAPPFGAATALLRPLRADEQHHIRRIFLDTVVLGAPAAIEGLGLDAYASLCLDWYLDEGDVVAVDVDGAVLGYLLICLDQGAYERWVRRRAARWLVRSLVDIATGRCRGDARRFTWYRIRDGWATWRHTPPAIYPAHAHLNLDARIRDGAIGHRLIATMDGRVEAAGLPGWFGEMNVPQGRSLAAVERAGAIVVHRQYSHTFSWLLGTQVERATVARPMATATDVVSRRAGARPGQVGG